MRLAEIMDNDLRNCFYKDNKLTLAVVLNKTEEPSPCLLCPF